MIGDLDAPLHLSDIPAIALVVDNRLRVLRLNRAAAAALGVDAGAELSTARAPFDSFVQVSDGKVSSNPTPGCDLDVSTTALDDGTTLVLAHDVSGAVERAVCNLAGGFVHELRNVNFGLMVMADMLDFVNHEALRHTRASIARLAAATDTLQELARVTEDAPEQVDVATIVDAAAERAWPAGSPWRLSRTGLSPCPGWGHPETLVRAVEVVLADVAAHAPNADLIGADVRAVSGPTPRVVEIAIRARGRGVPVRDLAKISWDALLTRRQERLTVGLGLARRLLTSQGGRLGARSAFDGGVELTIEIPAVGQV